MRKFLIAALCLALTFTLGTAEALADDGEVLAEEVLAEIDTPLTTYFGRVQDNLQVQVVNKAQLWYAEEALEGTEYEDLPVIAAMFPNYGGREGPDDYPYLEDAITTENEGAFYEYTHNTYDIKKLTGAELIEWMEWVAEDEWNQIDPDSEEDQFLVDLDNVNYWHDHFEGIEYQYDVTQPAGERVDWVELDGEPLEEDQEVLVASNDFKVNNDVLPHFPPEVIYSTDETRVVDITYDYLDERDGEIPELTHNWSFTPVETEGMVLFETSPDAVEYMEDAPEPTDHIQHVGEYGGYAIMSFDLSVGFLDEE